MAGKTPTWKHSSVPQETAGKGKSAITQEVTAKCILTDEDLEEEKSVIGKIL